MIQLNSLKHYFTAVAVAIVGAFMLAVTAFAAEPNTTELNANNINALKQQILNDDDFINALKIKLNDQQSETRIKSLVRDYLLENPEIMIEVQQALTKKQEKYTADNQSEIIKSLHQDIYNAPNDPIIGNPNGTVTLVEFYDYNCGFCKRAQSDIDALIKKNPDLKIVLKDFAILGEDSVKAHIVGQAFFRLMPEKYDKFHEELLLGSGTATEKKAMDIAIKLGAKKDALQNLMKDKSLEEPLQNAMQIAYALGINGTPTFIIDDKMIVGALGEEALQQAITAARKQ